MGSIFSNIMELFNWGVIEKNILMLGLDGAGKTTILYKLNLGETVKTLPTVGFNVETLSYKNVKFTAWDVGGQKRIRQLWHHYFQGTDAIVFVIDANDPIRLEESKLELHHLMQQDVLRHASLLVFANKQDLPNSMDAAQVARLLELSDVCKEWYVQEAVATTGVGLYEGLDWLSESVLKSSSS